MTKYTITKHYNIYTARWRDIVIEADTYHEAVERIMGKIKEVLWNTTEVIK